LIWIPKYRKPILIGDLAVRVRDLIRAIAAELQLEILSGKVARDHVHVFVSYRPTQRISQNSPVVQGHQLRVLLQEFPRLRKQFWERHFWARGCLAVSGGTITDEMVRAYIDEQAGEAIIDDSRFPIDGS
jgi:putative transposase